MKHIENTLNRIDERLILERIADRMPAQQQLIDQHRDVHKALSDILRVFSRHEVLTSTEEAAGALNEALRGAEAAMQ